MKQTILFYIFIFLFSTILSAQSPYPVYYFESPMDIPLTVSGTFGELRLNHFHSGIDFRTGGVIGCSVYAVAEGYVSRIRVSSGGGGKTLYITHPNGYKSVYMHLDRFVGKIANYVLAYQYEKKTFELDIDLTSEVLPVAKRQMIAKSGNTGSSGGPHLHFEIRQADNDRTINPLFFGYKLCDNTPPVINAVRIYPADENSLIAGTNQTYSHTRKALKGKGGKTLKSAQRTDTVPVWGKCYFGIDVFDELCNSVGRKGIYKLNLLIDNECVYSYCLKNFLFEDTRFANALTDYAEQLKSGKYYILTRLPSYVPIPLYERVKDKGIYDFTDGQAHKLVYQASDYTGNVSEYVFWLKSVKPAKLPQKPKTNPVSAGMEFLYSEGNAFSRPDCFVEIDQNTLYESIVFDFDTFTKQGSHYPLCFRIHKEETPLHKSYRLGIKAKNIVPENLKSKAFIAKLSKRNTLSYETSRWEGDFLTASPRTFGTFVIALDTINPGVKPLNFKNGVPLRNNTTLKVKITDNLSQITSYNCYLNDNWILAEYDRKNALLTIDLENKPRKGKNHLKISVVDGVGNETIRAYVF